MELHLNDETNEKTGDLKIATFIMSAKRVLLLKRYKQSYLKLYMKEKMGILE